MEKRKTALEYLIEQENKKSKAKIKELEKNNKQLNENNKQLNNVLTQIKNYYSKEEDIPKEILPLLLNIQ